MSHFIRASDRLLYSKCLILLQSSLLYAHLGAKEFEVPGDVAFIQLYQLNHLW